MPDDTFLALTTSSRRDPRVSLTELQVQPVVHKIWSIIHSAVAAMRAGASCSSNGSDSAAVALVLGPETISLIRLINKPGFIYNPVCNTIRLLSMPTVVIVSPKGGAGKSTAAVLLGTEMAHAGVPVTMMDCDPNRSLTWWSTQGALPDLMSILSDVTEASVVKAVKLHDRDGRLVVMDMEGVASRLVSRAISQADLVITPMRATTLDAMVGGRALQLVAEEEEALGRTIFHAVIFTMTRAIRTRQHAGIEASLEAQGVDIIRPPLLERAAFSAMFQFGGNLRTLPAQGNMEAAIDNASHFAQAVYRRLTGDQNERP